MKKIFLSAFLLFTIVFNTKAQEIRKNTIGLRFNYAIEATYQRTLTNKNRLDFNLRWTRLHNYKPSRLSENSLDYNSIQLVGVYQWVWKLIGQFNWYAGAGLGLGYENTRNPTEFWDYRNGNNLYAVAAGNIGIEYVACNTLTLSLDFRPEFDLNKNNSYLRNGSDDVNLGLSIRYKF